MKKILVISWFFPPINSSEGIVTYKLLKNSKFQYDVFTQKNNSSWSYGDDECLSIEDNINCIYSDALNLNDFVKSAYNYYLNNPDVYNPSLNDEKNPFGSVENLKLTHEITIFNLNKYAKNYKVFNYDKANMEELLNEIIS